MQQCHGIFPKVLQPRRRGLHRTLQRKHQLHPRLQSKMDPSLHTKITCVMVKRKAFQCRKLSLCSRKTRL